MAQMPFGYEQLNIEISGPETGAPLLLLHGWGSSAQLMGVLADALSDEFRVYNFDLPGHGSSPPPPEPWGVPEHAELIFRFIKERIGKPVDIIGHSNGGRISLYMASEPEMAPFIKHLVLISPSGIPRQRTWKYYLRSNLAKALKTPFQLLPEPFREFGLDWLRHSLVWKLLGSSDYSRLEGVMRGTFVKTVNFYVQDRLQRIKAPTLLFWGNRDEAITIAQMHTLEQDIPDAGLIILENAGHYGHLDDPDTVIAATRYFLTEEQPETVAAS